MNLMIMQMAKYNPHDLRSFMLNLIAMRNIFVAVIVLQSCSVAFAASQQPNIVVIFSDDHAYQAISAYGENRKLLNTQTLTALEIKVFALIDAWLLILFVVQAERRF